MAVRTEHHIHKRIGCSSADVRTVTFCPEARVISSDGEDWTLGMLDAARRTLEVAHRNRVHLAILMDTSAACGSQVIYRGPRTRGIYQAGQGVAAALLIREGITLVSRRDRRTLARVRARLDVAPLPDAAPGGWVCAVVIPPSDPVRGPGGGPPSAPSASPPSNARSADPAMEPPVMGLRAGPDQKQADEWLDRDWPTCWPPSSGQPNRMTLIRAAHRRLRCGPLQHFSVDGVITRARRMVAPLGQGWRRGQPGGVRGLLRRDRPYRRPVEVHPSAGRSHLRVLRMCHGVDAAIRASAPKIANTVGPAFDDWPGTSLTLAA
jgi:hypothetical protein